MHYLALTSSSLSTLYDMHHDFVAYQSMALSPRIRAGVGLHHLASTVS